MSRRNIGTGGTNKITTKEQWTQGLLSSESLQQISRMRVRVTSEHFARVSAERKSERPQSTRNDLLVAEADDRPQMRNSKLVNRGKGTAFQASYWNGEYEIRDQQPQIEFVSSSTLAPGSSVYLPIPPAWASWTIRCKRIDRQERWSPAGAYYGKGLQEIYLA